MGRYKNGIESRNKIYETSKRLFYQYGFEKTSIAMIAEEAGVPKGLVTYYFKKEELLTSMHEDMALSIYGAIEKQLGSQLENSLQWHLVVLQLTYMIVYHDPRKLQLYRYTVDNGLASPKINAIVNQQLIEEREDFGVDVTPEQFDMFITAQYGAYMHLLKVYLKTYDPEKSRELLFCSGTVALRMAGVNSGILDENIAKVNAMLDSFDLTGLTYII